MALCFGRRAAAAAGSVAVGVAAAVAVGGVACAASALMAATVLSFGGRFMRVSMRLQQAE